MKTDTQNPNGQLINTKIYIIHNLTFLLSVDRIEIIYQAGLIWLT
jgi:hypothetical protein